MHKKSERHFIAHILEHLFGVFVVLATATMVGFIASAQTTLTPTTSTTAPSSHEAYLFNAASSYNMELGTKLVSAKSALGCTSSCDVGYFDNGDWLRYNNVYFDMNGANGLKFSIGVDPAYAGKKIEVHLDSVTGKLIGTLTTSSTGAWTTIQNQAIAITPTTGTHDVYFVMVGNTVAQLHGFMFVAASAPTATTANGPISRDSHTWISGSSYNAESGTNLVGPDSKTNTCVSSCDVGYFDNGDWLRYSGVMFGDSGASNANLLLSIGATSPLGQKIELHLDSVTGPLIGALTTTAHTASWTDFQEHTFAITPTTGTHDVYLVVVGSEGAANLRAFKFVATSSTTPTPTSPTPTTSSSGTTIPPATQIVDASGNIWTVSDGVIYRNGAPAASSANVIKLYFDGLTIYQENSAGGWWKWNGVDWNTTTDPAPTPTPTPASVSALPVSFSATLAPETDCSGAQPMTRVFFAISNTLGGSFAVSSNSSISETRLGWGEYPLPNGTYSWRGIPNSGFALSGNGSGAFELHGTCLSSTTPAPELVTTTPAPSTSEIVSTSSITTTTSTSLTLSSSPQAVVSPSQSLPRPILKIFFNNQPITDSSRIFNTEDIELRVVSSLVKKATFIALDDTTHVAMQLGNGVLDDLLTTAGVDVWTYLWSAKNAREGSYKVFARILRTDGTTVETTTLPLTISHRSTETSVPTTSSPENNVTSVSTVTRSASSLEILARVNDPGACTTAEECKIYCESQKDINERCVQFARVVVEVLSGGTPSLSQDIPEEKIALMLADPLKRPKELPEVVTSPEEFTAYCAQSSNREVCIKALVRNEFASTESLSAKSVAIEKMQEEENKVFTERVGTRSFIDTDHDGITDYDEINIYHTNSNNSDTDHDGFSDGAEVLSRTNPLGREILTPDPREATSSTAKNLHAGEGVKTQNPMIAGQLNKTLFGVSQIAVSEVGLNEHGTTTAKKLRLSGTSLPNSFVTLFVFSDPIVAVVRTDESGAWTYILDKELPDGTHQLVSAITEGGGRILAKSEPLPFVKEAAAVSVGQAFLFGGQEAPGFFSGASLIALIAIVIAVLGASLSVIGFIVYRKKESDETNIPVA